MDAGDGPGSRQLRQELYYLVQRFLAQGPCTEAAEALRREIEANELVPKRRDWRGEAHRRSLPEYAALVGHLHKCSLLSDLASSLVPEGGSLLGSGARRRGPPTPRPWTLPRTLALLRRTPLTSRLQPPNLCQQLAGREYGGTLSAARLCGPRSLLPSRLERRVRVLGHLASCFCLHFDRSGDFLITGADDNLIKIWGARDGRLRMTLRGSSGEISDLSVNQENTLLAAGSVDKVIRVWCLQTGATVGVLTGHSAMITSLVFLPPSHPKAPRYLVSTSNDGSVFFWTWDRDQLTFQ